MKRITLLNLFFTVLWFIVLAFLFYIQLIKSNHFQAMAQIQHKKKIELLPKRGDLYDASGRLIATSYHCFSAYVLPKYLDNKKRAARRLADAGYGSYNKFIENFKDNGFLWLKRKFTEQEKKKIEDLDIFGVFIIDDMKRIYPFGELFASMVGKVDADNQGIEGLEYELNDYLKGEKGYSIFQKKPSGEGFPYHRYPNQEPIAGFDVYLTIDLDLQQILYEEIKAQIDETSASSGMGLILEPVTGEILALVNICNGRPWRNKVISDEFEPGSTFKVVTAATALDKGWRESDLIDARGGYIKYCGYKIKDFRDYGIITFKETFEHSSNVGVVKISQSLDREKFNIFARNLGFGEWTGIELPGEAKGNFVVNNKTSNIRFANICFGQGITTTLLQLSQAYATVANGGRLYRPYIIKLIKRNKNVYHQGEPILVRQALSKNLTDRLIAILTDVVENGSGVKAKVEDMSIAGKTGTAQKVDNGNYSHEKIIASFIGFFPTEAPSLLIALVLDEPQKGKWASDLCAPMFGRIAKRVVNLPKYNYRTYAKKS